MMRGRDFRSPDADIPALTPPSQIYTYALDTQNMLQCGPPDNPTNDIVLNIQMTNDRQIYRSIELATAEIPDLDYLDCELRVQPSLILSHCESGRYLKRMDGAETVFPCTWNQVRVADDVVTTAARHLLRETTCVQMWLWGASQPCPLIVSGKLCPHVEIICPFSFRVVGFDIADCTYVWCAPLSYYDIADIANIPFDGHKFNPCGFVFSDLSNKLGLVADCANATIIKLPCVPRGCDANQLCKRLRRALGACYVATDIVMTIYECTGVAVERVIRTGYYTPDTLCTAISDVHPSLRVCIDNDRMSIESRSLVTIKFDCEEPPFGFAFHHLAGACRYLADKPMNWIQAGIKVAVVDDCKLVISRRLASVVGMNHRGVITTAAPHGLSPNAAVCIVQDGVWRHLRVIQVTENVINVDWRDEWGSGVQCHVSEVPTDITLLGYNDQVFGHLRRMCGVTWISRHPIDTRGPTYVMMQIVDPIGSAQCEQLSPTGNLSSFIAKCVLLNTTRRTLDDPVPKIFKFFPARKVTKLHIRLLTPNGQLYQLYGKHWSATLLFKT